MKHTGPIKEVVGVSWCLNKVPHECTDDCEVAKAIVPELLLRKNNTELDDEQYSKLINLMIINMVGDPTNISEVNNYKNIIMNYLK